uniref:Reelin domain-containing protein n=1 Tax=Romanomermis culicivorax TaxID=13658 RepID=A0A915KIZ1_ROMCU
HQILVKINGTSTFQSFLIQARQTTKEGFLLDESRTGQFIRDNQWKRQGVRYMPCLHMDTITHSNGRSKSSI